MGEASKQVRVDNWGIFFLQRLQMFFNKTDFCDLTLQFEGNVQLKVHRLVMNACTEYFQVLEQQCGLDDDVLIMPPDLQSDVVVPIVNFMYTGMLEFHMSMYEKLYRTAELMNITVLTKLLEAQRQTYAVPTRSGVKRHSHVLQSSTPLKKIASKSYMSSDLPPALPGRKLPVWKRKNIPTVTEIKRVSQPDPLAFYDNTPKPTRFEWPEEDLKSFDLLDSSFDDISYTSKPLLTQDDELRASTSFDEVRQSISNKPVQKNYNNSNIDMEEVKNYVKEQKIRSDLTVFEENAIEAEIEYDSNSQDSSSQKRTSDSESPSNKRVRFSINEKDNKETRINIMSSSKALAEMNHTKIISELLKKYPHLVKKNKNIRLKIMTKSDKSPEQHKTSQVKVNTKVRSPVSAVKSNFVVLKTNADLKKASEEGPWTCNICSTEEETCEFVLYYLYRKHMTDMHSEKFDSLMCKYCGHKCTKHNMLMYHMYTKHGIKPPPAYNFPKCNQCHYVALTESLLIKHKINHTKYELQCPECKVAFRSGYALTSHMQITGHSAKSGKPNYDCQYCNKRYQSGVNLFSHIKMQHRDEARRDGIVSIDEIEENDDAEDHNEESNAQIREEDKYITPDIIQETHKSKEKIKILSNVKVTAPEPQVEPTVPLEPSSEAEALSNVASGIATSLGLVDIVVLNDNQQYILHPNNQQELTTNEPEFILPEITSADNYSENENIDRVITTEHNVITQSILNNTDIASTDELVMVLTDHDYGDGNNELISNENSNIVVLYSHPVDGQENQFITSQGNLMVNSQTGMIEIRNGATLTTPDQLVTDPQDTHIESIEMIQREINSHSNEMKQENVNQENVQQASISANEAESETQPNENVEHVESQEDEHEEEQDVQENEPENTEVETQQPQPREDEISEKNQEQYQTIPVSLSEDEADATQHQPHEEIEGELDAEEERKDEPMEIDEEVGQLHESSDSVFNVPQPTDETQETERDQDSGEFINEETSRTQPIEEAENSQIEEAEESSQEQEVSSETVAQESAEALSENEGDDVPPEQKTATEEEEYEPEPMEIDGGVASPQEVQVNQKENTDENAQSVDETDSQQENQDDRCINQPQPEETEEITDGNVQDSEEQSSSEIHESDKISEQNYESLEKNEDNVNPESDSKIDAHNTTEEDVTQSESYLEESFESTTNQDQNSQSDFNDKSQDENSRSSHVSQDSATQQHVPEVDSSKQTKISILDDWEDTDSQQSENNRGHKSGTAVHKLIDDWGDEEDDDSKKTE